ncbi:hypothetical protein DYB32_003574 [Aphanomyces invadans]|uniref:Uncharacterized protein n=1 Tax=Aphanomyces invadans TaxID=157072 RepID=A0A3R6ZSC2_9STRA|nr:hypothetical protein DYB32_003574 [Aphanomyces invadans]
MNNAKFRQTQRYSLNMKAAMASAAVVVSSILQSTSAVSIWEAQFIPETQQAIVHLMSFNFTNGGSYAVTLRVNIRPASTASLHFVVCKATAWEKMQSRGYPESTTALCKRRFHNSTVVVLHSLCSAYPMLGIVHSIPQDVPSPATRYNTP